MAEINFYNWNILTVTAAAVKMRRLSKDNLDFHLRGGYSRMSWIERNRDLHKIAHSKRIPTMLSTMIQTVDMFTRVDQVLTPQFVFTFAGNYAQAPGLML